MQGSHSSVAHSIKDSGWIQVARRRHHRSDALINGTSRDYGVFQKRNLLRFLSSKTPAQPFFTGLHECQTSKIASSLISDLFADRKFFSKNCRSNFASYGLARERERATYRAPSCKRIVGDKQSGAQKSRTKKERNVTLFETRGKPSTKPDFPIEARRNSFSFDRSNLLAKSEAEITVGTGSLEADLFFGVASFNDAHFRLLVQTVRSLNEQLDEYQDEFPRRGSSDSPAISGLPDDLQEDDCREEDGSQKKIPIGLHTFCKSVSGSPPVRVSVAIVDELSSKLAYPGIASLPSRSIASFSRLARLKLANSGLPGLPSRSISPSSRIALQEITPDIEEGAYQRAKRQAQNYIDHLLSVAQSPGQAKEMEFLNWVGSLGRAYGTPLVFLVGMGFWIQGFRCFPRLGMDFYFKDVLNVDSGTMQFVQNTVNLPMVAKPIYGIISDAVYIRGAHRVPYLVIGVALQAFSWGAIVFLPSVGSSVTMVAAFLALGNLGVSVVEVANDALVAECSKRKRSTGELQSFAWFSSAVGGVLGNLLGALVLSRMEFKTMFTIFLVLLVAQAGKSVGVDEGSFGLRLPSIHAAEANAGDGLTDFSKLPKKRAQCFYAIDDLDCLSGFLIIDGKEDEKFLACKNKMSEDKRTLAVIFHHLVDLVELVKQPEILYPLSWFVVSYAMVPTLAGTMFFYQTQYLKIDPLVVGSAKVVGQVGLMAGSVVYSRYLKGVPLRKLVGATQMLLSFCMLSDIILVKQVNVQLGIPNEVLVLGASAFVDAINQFKILPFVVLLAQLCPPGSEGSLLAFFMSMQCLATIVSGYLGVTLASFLHISSNSFEELPMGIFIESMSALLPLLWISFIPESSKIPTFQSRDDKRT